MVLPVRMNIPIDGQQWRVTVTLGVCRLNAQGARPAAWIQKLMFGVYCCSQKKQSTFPRSLERPCKTLQSRLSVMNLMLTKWGRRWKIRNAFFWTAILAESIQLDRWCAGSTLFSWIRGKGRSTVSLPPSSVLESGEVKSWRKVFLRTCSGKHVETLIDIER